MKRNFNPLLVETPKQPIQQRVTDRLDSTIELHSDRLEGRKMVAGRGEFLSHFYPTQRAKKCQNRENGILKNVINQRISVSPLTIYDMCKAVDRGMRVDNVRLLEKKGGKSGHWLAD